MASYTNGLFRADIYKCVNKTLISHSLIWRMNKQRALTTMPANLDPLAGLSSASEDGDSSEDDADEQHSAKGNQSQVVVVREEIVALVCS